MSKKAETVFGERVDRDLQTLPNSYFENIQQLGIRGSSDRYGCINGLFIAIELKSKGGRVSPLQKWKLNAIAESGGMAFRVWPDNWKNTFEALKALAYEKGEDDGSEELTPHPGNGRGERDET